MSHLHPGPTANRSGDATMTGPLSVILDRNVAAGMGLLLHPCAPPGQRDDHRCESSSFRQV